MIDVAAAREAYKSFEISDIGHIRSQYKCADAFTKAKHCLALEKRIDTGRLDHPVEEWILRHHPAGIG